MCLVGGEKRVQRSSGSLFSSFHIVLEEREEMMHHAELTREIFHCQNGMTGTTNSEEEQNCTESISDQLFIIKRK